MNKTYLGDAVYAEEDDLSGDIVLTTENGIEATNRIGLKYDVFTALLKWKAMVDKSPPLLAKLRLSPVCK